MADPKIPLADLPYGLPGAFDRVAGVDTATGAAKQFPMPVAGSPTAYEARSDLPASPPEGTPAYVNNDPNPDNNGLWAYIGGEWVQSADRVTGLEGRLSASESVVSELSAAVPVIEAELFEPGGSVETIGVESVAFGNTTQGTGTYVVGGPLVNSGRLRLFRAYTGLVSSGFVLRRFTRSGNTFTRVGADIPVLLALGPNAIWLDVEVNAGEYLGFYSPAAALIRRDNNEVAPNGGWYGAVGDQTSFTDATADARAIQVAFDVEYSGGAVGASKLDALTRRVGAIEEATDNDRAIIKAALDKSGVSAGYLFDEPSGAFVDLSRNGLHIAEDEYTPPRVAEGIYFPGGKHFSLPEISIKTVVTCHFVEKPIGQTGRLLSSGQNNLYTVTFSDGGAVNMTGMEQVVANGRLASTTNTPEIHGGWYIASFQSTSPPEFRIRVGVDANNYTSRQLTNATLGALLVFDRALSMDELATIHNALSRIMQRRGVDIPAIAVPKVLEGASAPNAATYYNDIPSPYTPIDRLTHPSVIDMEQEFQMPGATWNGYRYWMAITPFPPDANENPCIFASNDGDDWVVPPGVVNPVEPRPPGGGNFNSDTDLVFDPDKQTMHLFWRPYFPGPPSIVAVAHASSVDGWQTRTPTKRLVTEHDDHDNLLSPTCFYDDRAMKWRMYTVLKREAAGKTTNQVLLRESYFADGPYGPPVTCDMPDFYPQSRNSESSSGPWHIEVRRDDRVGGYICFASTSHNGAWNGIEDAVALTSTDGIQWFCPSTVLMTQGAVGAWDEAGIYRITGVKTATGYDLFYSAPDPTRITAHHLGRTSFDLPS